MNLIVRKPLETLGYDFIPKSFIPKGKNEYHLRNLQHRTNIRYRKLTPEEITRLEENANLSTDWGNVRVPKLFNPALVKNCRFFGLVRIGNLDDSFVEFNNIRLRIGLYNSTIISSDIGNNVVIDNVNFLSHYIISDDVILVNINELATTNHSKFGNGVLKDGEQEAVRVWMELCNENGGRSVLPFNGMLAGDAWLWSKYRDDKRLLEQFKQFTDQRFDTARGYYGKIGERTVIKNSSIIKDVWIGSDAYIKGANKLKNLTINSSPDAMTQIGEGCELVNGIIGFGCRIFYGVKAVRFVMGANSQLKYGARLINSFLGDNSTISCCEVLNSLILPGHEQHHNNSFLCAATVLGQSNVAAGATIGSNHNSRGADGELIAGRGFWPGLCVSLKHNSKFASFTLLAKGDFPAELNIPIPFSLVSHDVTNNKITVMPGYWFMYNMYALARNAGKYDARDKRVDKSQFFEYDYLAPDSVNEILEALVILKSAIANAWAVKHNQQVAPGKLLSKATGLLAKREELSGLEILVPGFENSRRKVELLKAAEAVDVFTELIIFYGTSCLLEWFESKKTLNDWPALIDRLLSKATVTKWLNIGGQLIPDKDVQTLLRNIRTGKVINWDEVHEFYFRKSGQYKADKLHHALGALLDVLQIAPVKFNRKLLVQLFQRAIKTKEWLMDGIYASRAKDYENPFRKMTFDSAPEMDEVIGRLDDNSFIAQQRAETHQFRLRAEALIARLP